MSIKNPLTPSGIEPATYRFVAQHLNHCATAVPSEISTKHKTQSVGRMWNMLFRQVRRKVITGFYHHHHKHQGLDPLNRSVSRVTAACANVSSVFQFFSFLVVCSGMISKGFGFVAFFANVKASSVCIHIFCLVCL